MAGFDASKYSHSPVHNSVISRDYPGLKKILSSLPRLLDPSEVKTEEASIAEEQKAEAIAGVIDCRDVPNRETPLHLAVKLADPISTELLMLAGADWSLQNEQGWSALQEAICAREENIAKIIVRHYQPLAWAKWCRRLPRLVATMRRMRDFYMEITFHFESSVIPFISRIAPSDTYKIWKRGANLRADMTLAGFDGFRIQRSDQSVLFLGDGSEDRKVPPGTLCMISHKDKEVMNALEGAGAQASEAEIEQEVSAMSQTNIFRPGIDVTQAVLLPQLNWRRQEKTEMVGIWRARVYDMHHVVVSVKSRKVPGAMSDEEFFSSCNDGSSNGNDTESEYEDVLTQEERKQLEIALKMDSSSDVVDNDDRRDDSSSSMSNGEVKQDKKGWFGKWGKKEQNSTYKKNVPPRNSLCANEKVSDLLGDSQPAVPGRHSMELPIRPEDLKKAESKKSLSSLDNGHRTKESEYKKGLRPVLWLSPNFPLRTEELLPLLDILANKVKAVRRLRDLLTTKLPSGTFPVKVAIPVVPTIRVLVTFTKFEEYQPSEEFSTPPSSPESKSPAQQPQSNSWIQWIKPIRQNHSQGTGPTSRVEDIQDPFLIPQDYTWTTPEAKKKKMQEKKGKSKKERPQSSK